MFLLVSVPTSISSVSLGRSMKEGLDPVQEFTPYYYSIDSTKYLWLECEYMYMFALCGEFAILSRCSVCMTVRDVPRVHMLSADDQ